MGGWVGGWVVIGGHGWVAKVCGWCGCVFGRFWWPGGRQLVVFGGCEFTIKTCCEQHKKLFGAACGGPRPPTHHLMSTMNRDHRHHTTQASTSFLCPELKKLGCCDLRGPLDSETHAALLMWASPRRLPPKAAEGCLTGWRPRRGNAHGRCGKRGVSG